MEYGCPDGLSFVVLDEVARKGHRGLPLTQQLQSKLRRFETAVLIAHGALNFRTGILELTERGRDFLKHRNHYLNISAG